MTQSVTELKVALEAERVHAAELAEKALAAVDTVLGAANFWLAILSFGLTLLGVVGVAVIYLGVKRAARKVADDAMKSYLEGEDVRKLIQQGIADEISKVTLVAVNPQRPAENERGGFRRRNEEDERL